MRKMGKDNKGNMGKDKMGKMGRITRITWGSWSLYTSSYPLFAVKTHEELDERVNGGDSDESEISFRLVTCEATMRKSELCKTLLSLSFYPQFQNKTCFRSLICSVWILHV